MFAKELLEKEVIGRGGARIGKVKDAVIDASGWRITAIQIELDGHVAEQFHMKKLLGSVTLPISVDRIQGVSDKIVLKSDVADLISPIPS